MQVIIVLETKNEEGSDYYYCKSIMKRFYKERGTGTKISYEFMNGKGNYEKAEKKVVQRINKYDGESKVVFFFDVDESNININQQKINDDIIKFCKKRNYEIVWFNRTVEEVLIGNIVTSNKTEIAKTYFKKKTINDVCELSLNINTNNVPIKCSNVLTVLDEYLQRT